MHAAFNGYRRRVRPRHNGIEEARHEGAHASAARAFAWRAAARAGAARAPGYILPISMSMRGVRVAPHTREGVVRIRW